MSWELGAGFRIVGYVTRQFVPPSGKVAFLTLDVPGDNGRNRKIDLRTFDAAIIGDVRGLGGGQTVQVTGNVDMESVKDKAKAPVMVDGREKWVPALTIKTLKVEASSAKPKAPSESFDDPAISDGKGDW